MIKNIITSATVAIVVSVLALAFVPASTPAATLGSQVETVKVTFGQGIDAKTTSSISGLTQGAGVLRISQTGATRTLTESELIRNSEIVIDSTTGAAALTLTLPATSTMRTLLPLAGDNRTWIIQNNHTAAATTTTVAAGAGIDLQGDTANDDVINGAVTGTLTCLRQYNRDVMCTVSEKVAAD